MEMYDSFMLLQADFSYLGHSELKKNTSTEMILKVKVIF